MRAGVYTELVRVEVGVGVRRGADGQAVNQAMGGVHTSWPTLTRRARGWRARTPVEQMWRHRPIANGHLREHARRHRNRRPLLRPSSGAPITGARTLGSAALARRRARKQQRAPRAARTHSGSATPSTHISAGGQRCHGGMSAGLSSMRKRPRPYAHAASGAGCVQMLAHMSTWGRAAVWFQLLGSRFLGCTDWSTDRARSRTQWCARSWRWKCRCGGSTEGRGRVEAKDGERTSAAPERIALSMSAAASEGVERLVGEEADCEALACAAVGEIEC